MLSSRHVAFYSADAFLFRLLRLAGHLLSILQSLLERKRRAVWNRSRDGSGDLAAHRHDRAADMGTGGGSDWRARAHARLSHAGHRARLFGTRLRAELLANHYRYCGIGAGRDGHFSNDDVREPSDSQRRWPSRVRSCAHVGHHRLLRPGDRFSLDAGILSANGSHSSADANFATRARFDVSDYGGTGIRCGVHRSLSTQ